MSVFVDTSAIYAGLAGRDEFHAQAVESWSELTGSGATLVTHSLVEIETITLLQARLGVSAVIALGRTLLPKLRVIEIDRDARRSALAEIAVDERRALSIVDRVSFATMRQRGITRAFAFDRHFAEAGFELIGPEA